MARYTTTLEALHVLWERCQSGPRKVYAPMLTLWTSTKPDMNKRCRDTGVLNPYLQGVERRVCRYGQIGCEYERCTNNQMFRDAVMPMDGDDPVYFRAEELWRGKGERVPGEPFLARHKETGRLYLCFKPREIPKDDSRKLMVGYDKWFDVATNLEIEVPTSYLKPVKPLVPGRIPWRTIGLDNILGFGCGEWYQVGGWDIAA